MVIVANRVGQLGNQLFHIAHFAASSIEHGYRVWFAAFEYSLEYFPNLNAHPGVRVSGTSAARNRFQSRVFKLMDRTLPASPFHRCIVSAGPPHVNSGNAHFVREARSKLVLCQGFGFRDPDNVAKHHQTLAQLFRLADPIREEVASFESEWIPAAGPTLVGFHIRRGDYGSYAGGEFFLDDAHWIDLIRQAREMVRCEGGRFHGILFSNEDIDHIVDSAEDLVRGPGGLFTDLEMLSRCDRIIAPPSTYSGWASFIGRVPLLRVDKSSVALDSSRWEIVAW